MLMLTHTYFLQNLLSSTGAEDYPLDVYVYNIVPDLLTIHPEIQPSQTHNIRRTLQNPPEYPGMAYIMFHLLLDDLAHYGHICPDCQEEFNPDSQGYSYVKGKPLINPMLDLYRGTNKEISYNEAAYRSHLIIEMIYDLAILSQINSSNTVEMLAEAIKYATKSKMPELRRAIKWLYGFDEDWIGDVMKEASFYITKERMERIMNIEGRVNLYANKFGGEKNNADVYNGINNLFKQARVLLNEDDELFLKESAQTIKKYGWYPTVT